MADLLGSAASEASEAGPEAGAACERLRLAVLPTDCAGSRDALVADLWLSIALAGQQRERSLPPTAAPQKHLVEVDERQRRKPRIK